MKEKIIKPGIKLGFTFGMSFIVIACAATNSSGNLALQKADIGLMRQICATPAAVIQGFSVKPDRLTHAETLVYAYALERTGKLVEAYDLYKKVSDDLNKKGSRQNQSSVISLGCRGGATVSGPTGDVVRSRLYFIEGTLARLDTNIAQTFLGIQNPELHEGLPPLPPLSFGPSGTQTVSQSVTDKALTPLVKPDTLDPFGNWFAHLVSYTSYEASQIGTKALGKIYPGLEGTFDSWQIDLDDKRVWRVGLRLIEKEEGKKLCQAFKEREQYCNLLNGNR